MFQNQYIFFLLLFILQFPFLGCSPSFKLTNGESISKKEIIQEVAAYQKAQKASKFYRSEKLNIRKRTEEKTDKENPFYTTINNLPLNKMSDAFPYGKKSIFYMKTGTGSKTYYQPDAINIFQPKSINDELFNEEVGRIIELLEKGEITMAQIKDSLNKDYDIGVQYFKNTMFSEEKSFKPEIIELLKDKEIGSVFKSEKITIGKATYLSLIQNLGIKKVNPLIHYISVTLK